MTSTETEVLIVGGGPAGLAMAALLGRNGVDCVLVERRASANPHPRARAVTVRTAEIFRQLGVLDRVEAVSLPRAWTEHVISTETLAGQELDRTELGVNAVVDGRQLSPARWLLSSQDRIEPILRQAAEASTGVELRFGYALLELEAGPDGATALIQTDRYEAWPVSARYVVAADGPNSTVRRQLGIAMSDPTDQATLVTCQFVADLDPWTTHRPAAHYSTAPPTRSVFQKMDTEHRWVCQIGASPDQHPDGFTPEWAETWIRDAIFGPADGAGPDRSDLAIDVTDVVGWPMASTVASEFRRGCVFLVGDAAHQLPPPGRFGLNNAIQDAHNLAWKLAAVLRGRADDPLLDSYHVERAPLAWAARDDPDIDSNFDLGVRYADGCVLADGVSDDTDGGRPGSRAPHVELADGRSTLDLYDLAFTLVVGEGAEVGPDPGPGLAVHRLSEPDDQHWRHGIDPTGALLVRPDGHVAWRAASGATGQRVAEALGQLGLRP